MDTGYRLALMAIVVGTMQASCGNGAAPGEAGPGSAIEVRKGSRKQKKGRIFEKTSVVQIPLTAEENNLKGKVHTVSYSRYVFTQNGASALTDSGYNIYDTKGNLTEQNAWNSKGVRKWTCRYRYDTAGKILEWQLDMTARKEQDTTIFQYDTRGRKIKAVTRANEEQRSGRKEYTYDAQGNETDMREYSAGGKIRGITHSVYDNKGNQLSLAELLPDGTPFLTRKATYDVYGSLLSLELYISDSMTSRTVMVNDARGKHAEIKSYGGDGKYHGKSVYRYNEQGHVLERRAYDAEDKPDPAASDAVFEYEYDTAGNVVSETAYSVSGGARQRSSHSVYRYTYYR